MRYEYKEERHPMRPNETRLIVTWPGYGWWHKLGEIVSRPADQYGPENHEVWPAHGLHRDVSRRFETHNECVSWLKELWEKRGGSREDLWSPQ